MKVKHFFFLVILIPYWISCKEQNDTEPYLESSITPDTITTGFNVPDTIIKRPSLFLTDTTLITEFSKIKRYLRLQENASYMDHQPDNPYIPQEEDMLITLSLMQSKLETNGFCFPTKEKFFEKLKNVFGYTPDSPIFKDHERYISVLGKNEITNTTSEEEFGYDFPSHFFIKESFFITEMIRLGHCISIQPDNSYFIHIPYSLIARNKYIFNDDKEALAFLVNFDQYFLICLVRDFGYDQDNKVNETVLNFLYNEYSEPKQAETELIGDLVFTKDQTETLQIRTGLLNYIEKNTSHTNNCFIYALGKYMKALFSEDIDAIFPIDPSKRYTLEEKAKIAAYIANIENPAIAKFGENTEIWKNETSSLYNISVRYPEIIEIIKQNNYYGLPHLEKVVDRLPEEALIPPRDPE